MNKLVAFLSTYAIKFFQLPHVSRKICSLSSWRQPAIVQPGLAGTGPFIQQVQTCPTPRSTYINTWHVVM